MSRSIGIFFMKRLYELLISQHLQELRQMIFLAGPRQVGKTTCSLTAKNLTQDFHYLNWDLKEHQQLIISGAEKVALYINLEKASEQIPIVVFDEIHKYKKWKQFLKGFFDLYNEKVKIIVTGSAKLNIYKATGDSLMGRYFLYRVHPLSVAEIVSPSLIESEIRAQKPIDNPTFLRLLEFGGFPEPFLKNNKRFFTRWHNLRQQQMIREDIQKLSQIQEIAQLEMLADVLKSQTGQLVNYANLANLINVSAPTIQRWIKCLESFYYCFTVRPWSKNVKRSLRKDPKIYLWDWSEISDPGARVENFIAAHLLKAVHFWEDTGFGKYDLYYIRDKEKREVDFLVTKDKKPWFLVEAKNSSNNGISKHLYYFKKEIQAPHAFQVVFDMDYRDVNCFSYHEPIIVPAQTFLSQLI